MQATRIRSRAISVAGIPMDSLKQHLDGNLHRDPDQEGSHGSLPPRPLSVDSSTR
jgi:hypothetical protein